MAKINNIAAYAISSPVTADDIVIGSDGGNGGDTKNFQMSDILTYIMSSSTLTLQDVCDNGSATTTGITVAGTTTLNGTVDINNTADISGNTTIGGTTTLNGTVDINNTADISGNTTIGGTTTLNGTVDINNTADISGAVTLGSTLEVDGLGTFNLGVNIANGGLAMNDPTSGIIVVGSSGIVAAGGGVSGTSLSTSGGLLVSGTSFLGEIDSAGPADIADTLTLSKPSGTGLSLPSSNISVGGSTLISSTAVTADAFQTNSASFTATSSAVQCSVAATFSAFDSTLGGTTTVNGVLDANSTADIADTLTLSKATGNGLDVVSDANIGGKLITNRIQPDTGNLSLYDSSSIERLRLTAAGGFVFQGAVSFAQAAPSSSTSTGSTGQIALDTNYIYVCVGANSWGRVAIDTTPF